MSTFFKPNFLFGYYLFIFCLYTMFLLDTSNTYQFLKHCWIRYTNYIYLTIMRISCISWHSPFHTFHGLVFIPLYNLVEIKTLNYRWIIVWPILESRNRNARPPMLPQSCVCGSMKWTMYIYNFILQKGFLYCNHLWNGNINSQTNSFSLYVEFVSRILSFIIL